MLGKDPCTQVLLPGETEKSFVGIRHFPLQHSQGLTSSGGSSVMQGPCAITINRGPHPSVVDLWHEQEGSFCYVKSLRRGSCASLPQNHAHHYQNRVGRFLSGEGITGLLFPEQQQCFPFQESILFPSWYHICLWEPVPIPVHG